MFVEKTAARVWSILSWMWNRSTSFLPSHLEVVLQAPGEGWWGVIHYHLRNPKNKIIFRQSTCFRHLGRGDGVWNSTHLGNLRNNENICRQYLRQKTACYAGNNTKKLPNSVIPAFSRIWRVFFTNFNALTFNELLLEDPFPEKLETLLTKECTECRSSSR